MQEDAMEKPRIEDVLVDLFESQQQAKDDLCGETRKWHLPRLNRVAMALTLLFPAEAARALARVKTPHDQ